MMRGQVKFIQVTGKVVEVWYESMTGDSSDSIIDRHEWHSHRRAMEVAAHIAAPHGCVVHNAWENRPILTLNNDSLV